jgi:hypothetical protein
MAAKILECSEDDLIHFAATQKIQIHVLTDGNTYARVYDSWELLKAVMLVHYEFFIGIESNVHPAPPLSLVVQDIDSKFHLNVFHKPFYNLSPENLSQESELYKGYCFIHGLDQITILTNFVILHSELMKLKKPVKQATKLTNVIIHSELMKLKKPVEKNSISDVKGAYVYDAQDKPISQSERTSMLKLIIGMAINAYDYDPDKTRNSATGYNSNGISAKLLTHGIEIGPDTVRKYLTEAKDLI